MNYTAIIRPDVCAPTQRHANHGRATLPAERYRQVPLFPVVPSFATLTPGSMGWWGGMVEIICGEILPHGTRGSLCVVLCVPV